MGRSGNEMENKTMEKRVFLIVLDSFGIGAEPDAAAFGDAGTNTLGAIAKHPNFHCPNLQKLGLFNIDGVTAGEKTAAPAGAFARLQEQSMGKDTTIGHWEIAGVVSPEPLPTFPEGFPEELNREYEQKTWLAASSRTSLSSLATKLVRLWLLLVRSSNLTIKLETYGKGISSGRCLFSFLISLSH